MGGRVRRLRCARNLGFGRHLSRRLVVRLVGAGVATGGLALMGVGTVGAPVFSNGVALQAAGGDNNRGDVWVDNVGQPPGPGHEQDPHLACTNINLWGNNLADLSGLYTIDGWQPTGSGAVDTVYGALTWHYNTALGGDQVISVINVTTLVDNAIANGDAPVNNQGLHFKLQFLQDPFKHKTFWVNCATPTTTTSSTTSSTASSTESSTTSSTESSSSSSSTSSTTSSSTTSTSSSTMSSTTSSTTSSTSSSTASSTSSSSTSSSSSTTSTAPGSGTTSTAPGSTTSNAAGTTVTSSGVGAGVLGASTTTPATGADAEFGFGLGLMIGGGTLALGAGRLFRSRKH